MRHYCKYIFVSLKPTHARALFNIKIYYIFRSRVETIPLSPTKKSRPRFMVSKVFETEKTKKSAKKPFVLRTVSEFKWQNCIHI